MRLVICVIAMVLLLGAALIGGLAPFGRVVLALGLPSVATHLFVDPHWRGVAYYRAGDFPKAAEYFAQTGPDAIYNLGNAEARRGAYAAALEAYDLAQVSRSDPQARANFDLLRAFYAGTAIEAGSVFLREDRPGPTMEAPVARGSGRASGTGDEVTNTGASLALAELESRDGVGVRQIFDDRFIAANARWLATLEDVPGAYLGARIAHEHKRRLKAGTAQMPEDTQW